MGLTARQEATKGSIFVYETFEKGFEEDMREKWPIVKDLKLRYPLSPKRMVSKNNLFSKSTTSKNSSLSKTLNTKKSNYLQQTKIPSKKTANIYIQDFDANLIPLTKVCLFVFLKELKLIFK